MRYRFNIKDEELAFEKFENDRMLKIETQRNN